VAQIIHTALTRRSNFCRPNFSAAPETFSGVLSRKDSGQQSSRRSDHNGIFRHNQSTGPLNSKRNLTRNNRSVSGHKEQASTPVTFGEQRHGKEKTRSCLQQERDLVADAVHSLSIEEKVSFALIHSQLANVARTAPVSDHSQHAQDVSMSALKKEIDLRAEEVLDSYYHVMKLINAKLNLNKEFAIFNLIAKLSVHVARQAGLTWSQALEVHFT